LVTDTTHGLIVNVEATTDAIDYRQLEPALNRCQETVESLPKQQAASGFSSPIATSTARRVQFSLDYEF
jgi:hypothetical protein